MCGVMERIGTVIREARVARGLDQATLARRAGTTQTYVSRVERGAVSPSWATVERLLAAAGQRPRVRLEPLPRANPAGSTGRADPEASVEAAFELSEFLTDLAGAASDRGRTRDG